MFCQTDRYNFLTKLDNYQLNFVSSKNEGVELFHTNCPKYEPLKTFEDRRRINFS